ncbi:unnamed protein product, partial [Porites lobata]
FSDRAVKIVCLLDFGLGKESRTYQHFLRPFSLSVQGLFSSGLTVPSPTEQEVRTHKAILLDVTVDAPARAMWLCMKQFNGYFGCGKCKEPEHAINPLVHAPVRVHEEMKKQALETMSMQENGKSKMSEVAVAILLEVTIESQWTILKSFELSGKSLPQKKAFSKILMLKYHKIKSWKNYSESSKSPELLFLKKRKFQYFQRDCSPLPNGSWWKPSRGAILEDICNR